MPAADRCDTQNDPGQAMAAVDDAAKSPLPSPPVEGSKPSSTNGAQAVVQPPAPAGTHPTQPLPSSPTQQASSATPAVAPPSGAAPPARPPSQPPPGGDRTHKSERPSMRPGGPQSLIGMTLSGRYRIEKLLGEGGMGAVYRAEHTHMRKRLAVKVLHPEMSRMPEVVARFEREAMAAAHIDHPNVATATDFGKLDDGSFFLVLEYVEGKSLRDALSRGRLELGRALHIMRQIAGALGRAHAMGIVHRDLKPENVMLIDREGDPDFVKVLDFGIAKVPVGELSHTTTAAGQPALTQLGMVYGTPEYMAPEQALGQPVDARADLYSLGIITFEMLTGVRPFEHESKVTLLGMHVTAPVPRMAEKAPEAHVPAEVEAIVGRLLAKDAAQRFADAKELMDAIGAAVSDLVAAGRVDPGLLDQALGPSGAFSTGILGPMSMRGSRASLPGVGLRGSQPAVAERASELVLRVKTYGARAVTVARGYVSRADRRTWAIGGGAVGALVVLVLFISLLTSTKDTTSNVTPGTDASAVVPKPKPPPPDHKLDEQVAAAEATIEKGDYAGAIEQLAALELSHADRADIHRDLERAYMGSNDVKDAMLEADLWLKADPASATDPRLGADVRAAAISRDNSDAAFAVIETRMGSAGADLLYDLAYGGGVPRSTMNKARASLASPEVRPHASPALAVTLDLRNTSGCEARHALLPRAREVGDARTVATLRPLLATRGCGFLGLNDCFHCMHHDGSLASTIDAIELRLATAKP